MKINLNKLTNKKNIKLKRLVIIKCKSNSGILKNQKNKKNIKINTSI
jgi:hypothetical protein